jgi:MoaA/NifB/PqqE/SkfB family radical SAM enzyme
MKANAGTDQGEALRSLARARGPLASKVRWARIAGREVRAAIAEETYLATGLEVTRPSNVVATLTRRCNYRCPMCLDWRTRDRLEDELSKEQWLVVLGGLHAFLGRFRIGFLGGEPFVRRDFLELLEFCAERGIDHSTTTNGSLLHGDAARRFVDSAPLHLNVSVDSPSAELNDRSRGVRASLEKAERAIRDVRAAQRRAGVAFPIRIKPTVHAGNFRSLPGMVGWAENVGADTVDFEPVRPWAPEVEAELWIGEQDSGDLQAVVEQLVAQRRAGAPIETSEHRMRGWQAHFEGRAVAPEVLPCRVGLRRFDIAPNGDVTTCWFYAPIGNVAREAPAALWSGALARERRRETVACTRACAFSCLAQKPVRNVVERWRMLTRSARPSRAPLAADAAR